MTHSNRLHWIWYIAAGLLALGALLFGIAANRQSADPQLDLAEATLYPSDFRPVAEFSLTDQDGNRFTLEDLKENWNLLFFGFTSCPDVCPMTLYTLQEVDTALEQADRDVRVVFVSVDPARDTPERVKRYINFFDPDFVGLTGGHDMLKPLTGSLGVFYTEPRETEAEGYSIDHSAGIFLINPSGRPRALFSAPHDSENIARDTLRILNHFD
jgi:protein SCO1/2